MSTVDEKGFLSTEISNLIQEYHTNYKIVFNLIDEVNEFSQKVLFSLDVHNDNVQELLLAILYIRAKSNFEGSVLLGERGMLPECKILVRALIEVMFAIVATYKEKSFAEEYINSDVFQRLDSLNKLNRSKVDLKNIDLPYSLDERKKELENQKTKYKARNFNVFDVAEKAELLDHYFTLYSDLCITSHPKIGYLEKTFDLKRNKFDWGPNYKGIDSLILTSSAEFIIILKTIIDFFKLEFETDIDELEKKCVDLLKKSKN